MTDIDIIAKNQLLVEDRRMNNRLDPILKELEPKVRVSFDGEKMYRATLINYSVSGIFFYVEDDLELKNNQWVPFLTLEAPGQELMRFQGKVRRVSHGGGRTMCAVSFEETQQFERIKSFRHEKKIRRLKNRYQKRFDWIEYLKEVPDFSADALAASAQEQIALAPFQEGLKMLSKQKRWWFVELFRQLKGSDPDFRIHVLDEFIDLCDQAGIRPDKRVPTNNTQSGLRRRIGNVVQSMRFMFQ